MSTLFVDKTWNQVFAQAMGAVKDELLIISPFIHKGVLERLLPSGRITIRVITRFNLADFHERVSDIDALELLLTRGAQIKGIKNLHAKVYVFDRNLAFVTSANLSQMALTRNHEAGITTENSELVTAAVQYFEDRWVHGGDPLTQERIEEWQRTLQEASGGGRHLNRQELPDFGMDCGWDPAPHEVARHGWYEDAPQFFVKFFGQASNRAPGEMPVLEEIDASGSHWACTYPNGKRPRVVQDGAVMFIARLVDDGDIRIIGRAIGQAYREGIDEASPEEIEQRSWKRTWPHYIRVHHAEFVRGMLGDGVSLADLKKTFGPDSFAATARNLASGDGNTNPDRAYLRQAAVQLTPAAARWLNAKLTDAMDQHGRIDGEALDFE